MIEVTVPVPDDIARRLAALADEADRIAERLEWVLAEEERVAGDWSDAAIAADPRLARPGLWWNRRDPRFGRLQRAVGRIGAVLEEVGVRAGDR